MIEQQGAEFRLKSWRLVDFKSVRKAEIEFRPLTLLVGANSSGKSSVLQSILLAVQSVQSGASNGQFSLNGLLVDLGTFEDVCNAKSSGSAGFGGTLMLPIALQGGDRPAALAWPMHLKSALPGAVGSFDLPGSAIPFPNDSSASTTVKWDVTVALAGARSSGSGQVQGAELDVATRSGEHKARYRLNLTKYAEDSVSAMFWPTGHSSEPEREVVVASLPAYSGGARRVKPKPRRQRMGAATFAGVLPVGLAAGQAVVESAVTHWIDYLRGTRRRKSRWSSRKERDSSSILALAGDRILRFRLGFLEPEWIAAAPWPSPAARSPVDLVVECLVDSLEHSRLARADDDVPWPWCLMDSLHILRFAGQLSPERLASLSANEPTAKLLYAIGFAGWVLAEQEQVADLLSESGPRDKVASEPRKYEFKSHDEKEWFAKGLAIREALDRHEQEIAEAVAAAFPDAGDACVEPGDDALVLSQASAAAAEFLQNNVFYLGPLREEPHRSYSRSLVPGSSALGSHPGSFETSGTNTGALVSAARPTRPRPLATL